MQEPRGHHGAERLPVSPQAPGRGVNWRGGPQCGASWKVPALCLGLAEERVVGCLWPSSQAPVSVQYRRRFRNAGRPSLLPSHQVPPRAPHPPQSCQWLVVAEETGSRRPGCRTGRVPCPRPSPPLEDPSTSRKHCLPLQVRHRFGKGPSNSAWAHVPGRLESRTPMDTHACMSVTAQVPTARAGNDSDVQHWANRQTHRLHPPWKISHGKERHTGSSMWVNHGNVPRGEGSQMVKAACWASLCRDRAGQATADTESRWVVPGGEQTNGHGVSSGATSTFWS